MGMASFSTDAALQGEQFRSLAGARRGIVAAGIPMDTLSMGMSDDFEAALAEGATMVRIGTAVFGARVVPAQAGTRSSGPVLQRGDK